MPSERYIVEARDADGSLLLGDHPQPPTWMLDCTEDQIAKYYFHHVSGDDKVTMGVIQKWFWETRSWKYRERYW